MAWPRTTPSMLALWMLAAVPMAMPAPVHAQGQEKRPVQQRQITVSAVGTVAAEPDMARISTGVLTEAETAREALTKSSALVRKIIDGLKTAGIDAKDIQTVHFGIDPRYSSFKDGQAQRILGYRVTNALRITVRDVGRVGEILDGVVTLGANQAGAIQFEVSKADALKDEARRQAMANALRRAKLYAEAAGAKVGPVITISEEMHGPGPRPVPMARASMSDAPVPVEAGSQTLAVTVHVTWGLE